MAQATTSTPTRSSAVRPGVSVAEDRLHRGDRHRELVEVGLARRQPLELQARATSRPWPSAGAVLAGELDQLERDAGDHRDAEHARGQQPVPGRQADRREDEDRDDHHDEQEARAAARVQAAEALRVGRRELEAGLVAGDRLVLGAVVLEDAAQVAQARQQR